jgi:hypothetical protein
MGRWIDGAGLGVPGGARHSVRAAQGLWVGAAGRGLPALPGPSRAVMGVLSRHTVTNVDRQRLAEVRPVTFAVTTRHHAVTFPTRSGSLGETCQAVNGWEI